jgi:hypothetical protein
MKKEQVELFKSIIEICGEKPTYLYGKSLLFLFLNKEPTSIDIFIKSNEVSDELLFKLKSLNDKIRISSGKELLFGDNEIFTVDCIFCNLKDVVGKTGSIEGKHLALVDLQKKNLRFIDKESAKNPKHIFEAILFANEIEFNFEIDSMKQIFLNKTIVSQMIKRDVYHFLKNLYFRSVKPRKAISLFNAFGLSMELFGTDLVETAVLNNLGKKDINEFFALIFGNIEEDQLESFLIEKVGFHLRDTDKVIQVTKIINSMRELKPTAYNARQLIRTYGKDKALQLYRLFKALGFTEMATIIKQQRNAVVSIDDLCVNVEFVAKVFNVDDVKATKLLDLALNLVIMQPELNDPNKLMVELNKQKSQYSVKE